MSGKDNPMILTFPSTFHPWVLVGILHFRDHTRDAAFYFCIYNNFPQLWVSVVYKHYFGVFLRKLNCLIITVLYTKSIPWTWKFHNKFTLIYGGKRITIFSIIKNKHDNYIRLANVGVSIFNVGIFTSTQMIKSWLSTYFQDFHI
jgi:hypothetical protein